MRKVNTLALLCLLGFFACTKPGVESPGSPAAVSTAKITLQRSLTIPGVLKSDTTYQQGDSVNAIAYYQGSLLKVFLPFDTDRRANAFRDVLYFSKDTTQLSAGLTGTYSLNTTDYPRCWNTLYSIEYVHPDGYKEFRYAVTEFGQDIRGELKIERYDPARGTISGSFTAVIANLAYNQEQSYPVMTTNPGRIEIAGTFAEVKLKKN